MLFRPTPPDPTRELDISDLRAPNEFDMALLASEGVRQGPVVIRGAAVAPPFDPRARVEASVAAPPPAPIPDRDCAVALDTAIPEELMWLALGAGVGTIALLAGVVIALLG